MAKYATRSSADERENRDVIPRTSVGPRTATSISGQPDAGRPGLLNVDPTGAVSAS
jgi:hypothetical protein